MKILQFGNTDIIGTRFNGQDLHQQFTKRGFSSRHIVWDKKGLDVNTEELVKSARIKKFLALFNNIENRISLQSLLSPSFLYLLFNREFLSSDIVHYHLLHTGYFSLLSLPILSRVRPAVWTLHDPWALTGHCIYPFDCTRWKTGCGSCPRLSTQFAMRSDHTALMWKMKKLIYANSKLDIIVASKHMEEMVQNSPLFSKAKVHHIPFGINLDQFSPLSDDLREEKRRKLGIKPGNTVICFRSTTSSFKGLEYIFQIFTKMKTSVPLTILTFNDRGHFDPYIGKHQVIELGWVDDLQKTIDAYQVADIFLMPSTAEAFGMMAMEAMACQKPVIVFEGTSLPEVIFAPQGGIAVPKDADALLAALMDLINNVNKREEIGRQARKIALQHYDVNTHVDRTLALYEEILHRDKSYKKHSRCQTQVG